MTSPVASTIDASRPAQGGTALAVSESSAGSDFLSFLVSAEPAAMPSASGGSSDPGRGDLSAPKPVDEEDDKQSTDITSPGLMMVSAPVPTASSVPLPAPVEGNSENGGTRPESNRAVERPAGPGVTLAVPTTIRAPVSSSATPGSNGVAARNQTSSQAFTGIPAVPAAVVSGNASNSAILTGHSESAVLGKPPEPASGNLSGQSLSGERSLLASDAAGASETPLNLTATESLVRELPEKQWIAVDSERPPTGAEDHAFSVQSDILANPVVNSGLEDSPVSETRPFYTLPDAAMQSVRVVPESSVSKSIQTGASASALADVTGDLVGHTAQVQVPVGAGTDSLARVAAMSTESIRGESGGVGSLPAETNKNSVTEEPVSAGMQQTAEPGSVQDPENKRLESAAKPALSELGPRQTKSLSESGTPAAPPSNATMLAQQENKTAGLAGKNIPAGTQIVSFEAEVESSPRMPKVRSVEGREPAIFAAYREGSAVTPDAAIHEGVSQPVSFDAVEKAQALINDAAVRVNKREGAALEVTIKPDAGTELSLHIRFHAGQIEARAVCQRGDHAALQSNWPELQEKLARQGIKLSGLETAGQQAFTGFTGQNPGHRRSAPDMAPELPVFSAPLNRTSKTTTQAARRVSSGNAWETWA